MGFLSNIANSVKRDMDNKTKRILDAIEHGTLTNACDIAVREFKQSNIIVKNKIISVLRREIQLKENSNELYDAFQMTYRKKDRDTLYMNMSQWIGAKLYEDMNDYRIEATELRNQEGQTRTFYKPKY